MSEKDLNYDFSVQNQPAKRMGSGDFANLPDDPIYSDFGGPSYRGGNINSFTASITNVSGIAENRKANGHVKRKK